MSENLKSERAVCNSEGKRLEIFFSYSALDKKVAGPITYALRKKGFNVFLAHEDIEISEEWRKTIIFHLRTANVLIALLTPNYEKSVWANQEAGYFIAKGKIIPLIVGDADIGRFGFIESFQGISIPWENFRFPIDGTMEIDPYHLCKIIDDILTCIYR